MGRFVVRDIPGRNIFAVVDTTRKMTVIARINNGRRDVAVRISKTLNRLQKSDPTGELADLFLAAIVNANWELVHSRARGDDI